MTMTDQVASQDSVRLLFTLMKWIAIFTKNFIDLMMYHRDNPQLFNLEENMHESLKSLIIINYN